MHWRKEDKKLGIAWFIALAIIIAGAAVAAIAVNNLTQKPNVIYNIEEPSGGIGGITIGGAGLNINWVVLGLVAIMFIYVFLVLPRRRSS